MIGITGVATSGKDTLYQLIHNKFKEKKMATQRYALADLLKKRMKDFIQNEFDINIDKMSPREKESIRPILVAYGKIKRQQSNGRFWINLLDEKIIKNDFDIPVITDIRYCEYEKDELHWLVNENNGFLVHISRVLDGKIIEPANEEEAKNDYLLSKNAHYKIVWCTNPSKDSLEIQHQKNLEEIYELYTRHRFNR